MALIFCFLPLIIAVLILSLGFKLKFSHQLLAILFGLIAVFPIAIIQFFLPEIVMLKQFPVLFSILKSLFLYGLVEEAIKMGILWPLPHKEYNSLNFLLLAFVVGLSLGCFESVVYFIDHLQRANDRGAQLIYSQIFTRIFTSDIIHMTCTGLSGLFVYSCRQKNSKPTFFILAVLLHGLYDFFAGFQTNLHWFSIIVVLLAIAECRIKYTSLQNDVE